MLLATAAQMREADRRTIEEIGLPGIVLMENAAQGAARVLVEALGQVEGLAVAAFCGSGNNGGDGFAVLRILAQAGAVCTAYLLARGEEIKGDAAVNLRVAKACGVMAREVGEEGQWERHLAEMAGQEVFVDALLGTGLNTEVKGKYRRAIELMNELGGPVLAVDIPSGLCADTGRPLGVATRANWTATFGLVKVGLAMEPGEYVGRLHLVEIGIPGQVKEDLGAACWLLGKKDVAAMLPERPPGGHKGSFGHLLCVGGSVGKSGAACLMAMGGIRAGAGLVTAALPEGLNPVAEMKLTAAMTQPLPQTSEGGLSLKALPVLLDLAGQRSALALGPGLGQGEETAELARELVRRARRPLVLDADGLNALAGRLEPGAIASPQAIITPHPGEAARLLGSTTQAVQADRLAAARTLASKAGAVAVLKGARTVIAAPDGRAWICPTGNQLLASGGSGDVLTGLIGGLLAQGASALEAACAGVYLHGLAAELAASEFGQRGMAAEELPDYLPGTFSALEDGGPREKRQRALAPGRVLPANSPHGKRKRYGSGGAHPGVGRRKGHAEPGANPGQAFGRGCAGADERGAGGGQDGAGPGAGPGAGGR